MKSISILKAWMAAATPLEQEHLAKKIGTTRAMLYQYAGGHRQCSAERAGQIAAVSRDMHRLSKGRLPVIERTDLAEACLQCEFARKCLGERATISEFPIVA
jgi:hypothetical protein